MDAAESLPSDLVFVDLETTGGNAAYHRITEVGIVRVESGGVVEAWSSLVNPGCAIPSYIEGFTGITNEMVATAPRFCDIAAEVRGKLRGAVLVAHNARFDYSFLRAEFRRLDLHFSAQVLCTVKLSRRLFPQYVRHNLDAVMERHGLTCTARHRALGDARVLYDLWTTLRREVPETVLNAAAQSILGASRLPAHLPADFLDDLPEGPGAYRAFGEGDVLLYVGKSNGLRTHVHGQLSSERAGSRERRLAADVRRVDWVETAGELGAALREAEWLKNRRPVYNRRVKTSAAPCTLRVPAPGEVPAPLKSVEVCPIESLECADLARCFGVFHSEKEARKALLDIAGAHQLCLKILGLEASEGSCFAYQIGKCKGACVNHEPLMLHHMRVQLALSALKLKAWPFPGRIALREGGDLHVIEEWSYLGTAKSEDDLETLSKSRVGGAFDPDVYRILVRYLSNHPNIEWRDLRNETAWH